MGTTPSTTNALFALKEPEAPGVGNVKFAALPVASFIVPLFKTRAFSD